MRQVSSLRWDRRGSMARYLSPVEVPRFPPRAPPRIAIQRAMPLRARAVYTPPPPPPPPTPHPVIRGRARFYRQGRYALHVGASSARGPSSYRTTLTVQDFRTDETLARRASAFIRRELIVLDYLTRVNRAHDQQRPGHILGVLRTVDMQSANGAAERILDGVCGGYAAHFLHELRAFLRSPYMRVEEWDEMVRYGPPTRDETLESAGGEA
jgi:hypothetical protein